MKYKRHIFVLIIILLSSATTNAESLYVFYPETVRPHILQAKLSSGSPGVEITVFGRYRDFIKKVKESPPDAILSKPFVIKQIQGFNAKLTGMKNGKITEPLILLSIEKKVDLYKLPHLSVGMIDYLGRKETQNLVNRIFKNQIKLKRTSKLEDLLPLLTFNIVDSILIAEKHVTFFMNLSTMNLVVTRLPDIQIGIAELAVKNGSIVPLIEKSLKNMNSEIAAIIGVEQWK